MDEKTKERLDAARRLMDDPAATSKQLSEGAKIVRELAEINDCLEAWQYMLDCHERGVGPFKTNKFRRAARDAITRLNVMQSVDFRNEGLGADDLSWCRDKVKREAMLGAYAKARRQ